MRAWAFLLCVAGCGRFGFDGVGATGDDAASDAPVSEGLDLCDRREVVTLDLAGESIVAIRATAIADRYAVALETTNADVRVLELAADATLIAQHTTMFQDAYAPLYGISHLDGRPMIEVANGAVGYLKLVDDSWDAYETGPYGDALPIDPPLARLPDGTALIGQIQSGIAQLAVMDAAGAQLRTAAYQPPAIAVSFTATPTGARVVVGTPNGTCETFTVAADGSTGTIHSWSPCFQPRIAALADATAEVVYRGSPTGSLASYSVPTSMIRTFPAATEARIVARDGAYWIGHGNASYRAVERLAGGSYREAGDGRLFDLTERAGFWIDGSTLHVATPCLR